MELFEQLLKIADKQGNKEDADTVRLAASHCLPKPKPTLETTKYIEGFGYTHSRLY